MIMALTSMTMLEQMRRGRYPQFWSEAGPGLSGCTAYGVWGNWQPGGFWLR
jgi:hypothetical protein